MIYLLKDKGVIFMGTGFQIKCKKCGHTREFDLGIGLMYTEVYKKKIKEINQGKLGEEYKVLMRKHPNAVVDASTYVYYCPECYKYILEHDNSLYNRKDNSKKFGVLYQWKHICPICGKEMLKTDDEDFLLYLKKEMLHCENCGATLDIEDKIVSWFWD